MPPRSTSASLLSSSFRAPASAYPSSQRSLRSVKATNGVEPTLPSFQSQENSFFINAYGDRDDDDDEADSNDIEPYSIDQILEEARIYARKHGRPDFLIRHPGEASRVVEIEDGKTADIIYEQWDDKYGYWVIEDDYRVKKIVKHHRGSYFISYGHRTLDPQPIAKPLKGKSSMIKMAKTETGAVEEDVGSEYDDRSGQYSMRQRNKAQVNPYQVERRNHKRKMAGKPTNVTSSDTEHVSAMKGRVLGPKRSCRSDTLRQSTGTPAPSCPSEVKTNSLIATDIYTTLDNASPIPVRLPSTLEELFVKVDAAWELDSHQRYSLTVTFPWKVQFTSMTLKRGLEDTFAAFVDNVRNAPCWKNGENCEIEAVIVMKK